MKALIATNEPRETGYRVAQVEPQETFHADMPLFWTDCPDYVAADKYWYNPVDQQFVKFPEPPPPPQEIPVTQT